MVFAVVGTVTLAGCGYNPSPIHADLDREEFCSRVREAFRVGMPIEEVEQNLEALKLDHEFEQGSVVDCESPISRGFHPSIYPGGLYWSTFPLTKKYLHIAIEESGCLRCVSYSGSGDWSGGMIVQ